MASSVLGEQAPPRTSDAELARALAANRPAWWHRIGAVPHAALLTGIFGVLIGLWQLLTDVMEVVNPLFLPAPSAIATSLTRMFASGEIYPALGYSAVEWLIGYGASAVVGVLVGAAMGTFTSIGRLVGPWVWLVTAAPWVAFQPLYTVWFGFGQLAVVMLVFTASVTVVIFHTAVGVQEVPVPLRRAAAVFGASPRQVLWKVVLPSAGPFVLLGLRYALVGSTLAVLLSEIEGSTKGLGGLLTYKASIYQTEAAYGILLLPIVVTVVLGGIMQAAARRLSGGHLR